MISDKLEEPALVRVERGLELAPELRAHQAVDAHVERGVDSEQEVAEVDRDEAPRGEGVRHPASLAEVGRRQRADFMDV